MAMDVNKVLNEKQVDTSFLRKPILTKSRDDLQVPYGPSSEEDNTKTKDSDKNIASELKAKKTSDKPKVPGKVKKTEDLTIEVSQYGQLIRLIGPAHALYYIVLKSLSSDGVLELSHKKIAAELVVHLKSVPRILKLLRSHGLISVLKSADPTNKGLYRIENISSGSNRKSENEGQKLPKKDEDIINQ